LNIALDIVKFYNEKIVEKEAHRMNHLMSEIV